MSNEILTFGLRALAMLSCNHWSLVFIVFPACSTQGRFATSVDYLAVACSHCPQQFHRKIVYLKNKIPGPLINIRPSIISLKCYAAMYKPVPSGYIFINSSIAGVKGLQKFPLYIWKVTSFVFLIICNFKQILRDWCPCEPCNYVVLCD